MYFPIPKEKEKDWYLFLSQFIEGGVIIALIISRGRILTYCSQTIHLESQNRKRHFELFFDQNSGGFLFSLVETMRLKLPWDYGEVELIRERNTHTNLGHFKLKSVSLEFYHD
ncbi:hypothetical protein OVS_04375 [Mycoplasma ovis str. Michigan]|uniref:Uncharacterized protein n=1 Tax=Mycoplasma ovis str. Michigan TaxID=1415773 RepID=A0ABN4BNZ7_9MOLU|nr:hypothetical protein [Mycoplasma ovis]AHC40602.1 hypothetical protein OVS_04375 [Mycoplasma ovis str. Michigan]